MLLNTTRMWLLSVMVGAAMMLPQAATGQDGKPNCKRSQDCALNAFKGGEIRPLSEILAVARERLPGEVVKIELEREDGIWVYEIKILTSSGRRREIEIDARTLAIIKIE